MVRGAGYTRILNFQNFVYHLEMLQAIGKGRLKTFNYTHNTWSEKSQAQRSKAGIFAST